MRPPAVLRAILHFIGRAYVLRQLRNEVEAQRFKRYNERPIEYRFVFQHVTELCPQTILDVGTGTTALPAILSTCGAVVTASDNVTDYWPQGMFNRHWLIEDDNITKSRLRGPYDMVTCISVLEHIEDHRAAVREMFRLVAPGGHVIITCPYSEAEYVENVYRLSGAREAYRNAPYICRSYSRQQLEQWITDTGATIASQEFWRIETGRVHALGDWLFPPVQVRSKDIHQLTCLLLQKEAG